MADEATNRQSFAIQAGYCLAMGAPVTARVCQGLHDALSRETKTGSAVLDWPGEPIADALPLRLAGGVHALHQSGAEPALAAIYSGRQTDAEAVRGLIAATLDRHDAELLPWLSGPPQTNEAGRSAAMMVGLLQVAARFGQPIELLEIGSSAGLNLLIDRYRYDLGGVTVGPENSPVTIRPEWRGPRPLDAPVRFASVRGVDIAPVDVRDPAQAARLQAYAWVDQPERAQRIEAGIAMIQQQPVDLVRGDAADWLEARLAEPQAEGVTRVLMHSVVWQYLPPDGQQRIRAAMHAAGAAATAERPLAWVVMEPRRDAARHEIRVRIWPDGAPWSWIATTHPHGLWVETHEPRETGL